MARFTLPRDLYFGAGSVEELSNLKGKKKAIIVTGGSSMQKFGFLQRKKIKKLSRLMKNFCTNYA